MKDEGKEKREGMQIGEKERKGGNKERRGGDERMTRGKKGKVQKKN